MSDINSRIKQLVEGDDVFLFMKGSPDMPQCGFSMRAITILDHLGAKYGTFNILSDSDIREGVKRYGNWPTYPQLWVRGELLGGSDIMMEMFQNGELETTIKGEA
jgi:monothiol glutaredoxin